MEGLLLRLSTLDADAENAVRVIGFFDRLVTARVDLDTLVRATTGLAECPAGVSTPARGIQVGGPVPPGAVRRDLGDGAVVWLARTGTPLPLDEILLERFAIAAALLLDHSRMPLPVLGDPALVELALSASAGEAERSRALHLLGLAPTTVVRVLAVDGDPAELDGPSALIGPVRAVLATSAEVSATTGRVGVSAPVAAVDAPQAWVSARTALRFTSAGEPVVHADDLGGLALLAGLPAEQVARQPDVLALDRLAADPGTLDLLTAVSRTSSVRQAAALSHRHHSTVAARLAQAETVLGFPPQTPEGRFRLRIALTLRTLRDTA